MEAAYFLLMGAPLLPSHEERLAESRVVHANLDPTVSVTTPAAAAEDDEAEGGAEPDPDKAIKNARKATKSDGLLSNEELIALYDTRVRPKSAYEEGQRQLFEAASPDVLRCGERLEIPLDRQGAFEPRWTNYTYYWQLSLGSL